MPRPKTKEELLDLSAKNFRSLHDLIQSFTAEQLEGPIPEHELYKNVRDVLAHLHHWHTMMLNWYEVGMTGEKPHMPAKGYTWKTVPDLNRQICRKYKSTSLEEITSLLQASYEDLRRIMEKHTDTELFEKKLYPWTGTTSLGSYMVSATSSHYDWALKLLKKYKKSLA